MRFYTLSPSRAGTPTTLTGPLVKSIFWTEILSRKFAAMRRSTWSVQDAKNRFSAVIQAASRAPQVVTRHGKAAVVVIDAAEYERLRRLEQLTAPRFSDQLLALPSDDGEFERLEGQAREPDL
jgi:antitoxin Phd